MTKGLPRINILINDTKGRESESELSLLSLGFGIHQAWIYASMFGTTTLFQTHELLTVGARSFPTASVTCFFIAAIIAFVVSLFFIGMTDQRFLGLYTSKTVLRNAAVVTSMGTFLLFASTLPDPLGLVLASLGGLISGSGSALLLVFWGTAFARSSSSSIVANSAVAIALALAIYSLLIYAVPSPLSAILTALLPLVELPLLQGKTPESYIIRHEVPVFRPLPVNKLRFTIRFAAPVLLTGFSLGALRSIVTQVIVPSATLSSHALVAMVAGVAGICVFVVFLLIGAHRYWDSLFRVLVPLMMVAFCFVPISVSDNSIIASLVLTTGFVCFEALMWIFFAQMCQTFRLSAVFVFGIGRGCLALGALAGTLSVANPTLIDSLTPYGELSGILAYLAALVLAYITLPRVTDIKRMIDPTFDKSFSPIDMINDRAEELRRIVEMEEEIVDAEASCGQDADIAANVIELESREFGEAEVEPRPDESEPQKPAADMEKASAPAEENRAPGKAAKSTSEGAFRARCESIANEYLLSRRETEVLYLLAKGRNAAYIQKKLVITQSTAKTHIYHIYQKLGIHKQNELLAMVSDLIDE